MSIYRRKLKSGKRSKRFSAEFVFRGRTYRRGGFVDRDHARDWVTTESNRLRRGATGYVKAMTKAAVMPLIDRFAAHLRGKGVDEMYAYTSEKRLRRLAGECGWVTLEHVTAPSLDAWKAGESRQGKRKPIGARTKNQYVQIAQEWGKWLVKPGGVLPANPLADVTLLRAKHNDAYRRAGTVDELNRLLAVCGEARRLFYLFRIYQSSVRGKTLAALRWRMMQTDANPPFILVPGEIDKGRRDKKYVMRFEIAQELRAARKRTRAKADDLVFPDRPTLADFKTDLAAAGVAFELEKDRHRLDYHAMRATLVELGKNAGLSAFQVMELLGHRDIRTTMKYYNKRSVSPESGASMERLPTLGQVRKAE